MKKSKIKTIVSLIPTGIKCSIGGYIGDATLATNKLAAVCDYLITNPNAVNAGAFNFKAKNVLYVEGCAIDKLLSGKIGLGAPKKNKIGIILENISDKIAMRYVLKSIEAFSLVAGVEISGIEFIPPIPKSVKFRHGQFCGSVEKTDELFGAAEKLLRKNAEAIAVLTLIKIKPEYIRMYQKGSLPNPYGFMEALISHSITDAFLIPCAHAPILSKKDMDFFLFSSFNSDPRSSFENISSAYAGSILLGLNDAPRLVKPDRADITASDIGALVVPANCLRSIPVAFALKLGIPVIEVKENKNIFRPLPRSLTSHGDIYSVDSYGDAADLIRGGLNTL